MSKTRLTNVDLTVGSGVIVDDNWSNQSGDELDADKMQHIYKAGTNFATAIGAAPATREEIVFMVGTAGTLRGFSAVLNVSGGATTDIDFDLKVNGSTVLSAVVNIDNSQGDTVPKAGTISSPAVIADDVISISMTATDVSGSPTGAFAWVDVEELAV